MQYETFQKTSKDGVDATMKSLSALSRGFQAAALEATDFAKRSFEQGSAVTERLLGARSLDRAVEIQGEFVRESYQGLVAQATKMGELAASTAKEAYAPVETLFVRNAPQAA